VEGETGSVLFKWMSRDAAGGSAAGRKVLKN
jgi:hypothetical protein